MAHRRKPTARQMDLRMLGLFAGFGCVAFALTLFSPIPITGAEAQIWLNSARFSLGYIDTLPGAPWIAAFGILLFGDTVFGLRIGFAACLGLCVVGLYAASRAAKRPMLGALSAVTLLSLPLMWSVVGQATPIPLAWAGLSWMMFFVMRAARARVTRKKREPYGDWAAAGALAGGAALAFFASLVVPIALLITAVLFARSRQRWRGPALAVILTVCMLLPNLVWQVINGFPTVAHAVQSTSPDMLGLFLDAPFALIVFFCFGIGPLIWFARYGHWAALAEMRVKLILSMAISPVLAAPVMISYGAGAGCLLLSVPGLALLGGELLHRSKLIPKIIYIQAVYTLTLMSVFWCSLWLYAAYAPGLPQAADPFRAARFQSDLCEPILVALEDYGVEYIIAMDRTTVLPCAYQGGLRDHQVKGALSPTYISVLEAERYGIPTGESLLLTISAENGAALAMRAGAQAVLLSEGQSTSHLDQGIEYALWLVSR